MSIKENISTIKVKVDTSSELKVVLHVIAYHAIEVLSLTMQRLTAEKLQGFVDPSIKSIIPNPFTNDIVFFDNRVTVDDKADFDIIEIKLSTYLKSDVDEIKRKLRQYTTTEIVIEK